MAFYYNWRIGLLALAFLILIVSINVIIIIIVRERKRDSIVFSQPKFKLKWDRDWEENAHWKLEQVIRDDEAHYTLHCPVDDVGVNPEFSIDIKDGTSFPFETQDCQLSFFTLLQWKDRRLTLEPGTTKPSPSWFGLFGYFTWEYEFKEEAPDKFVQRIHLHYSPDKSRQVVVNKTVTIVVQIEQDK